MNLFHGTNRKFIHLKDRILYHDPTYPYKGCCAQLCSFVKHACVHYTYWYMELVLLIFAAIATARIAFSLLFSSDPYMSQSSLLIAMGLGFALVMLFATLYKNKKEDKANLMIGYRMPATFRRPKQSREMPVKLKEYPVPQLLETRYKDYRSSGFRDFLETNLLNEKDFREAEFRVFTLIAKKIVPNVYQNFKICLETCNEILKKHNLEIVFDERNTDKVPLLLQELQYFVDFLKRQLLGINCNINQKSNKVALKYKQFSKNFLASQVDLKKELLEYMYHFQVFIKYFQPAGFQTQSFNYVYNRAEEIEKMATIEEVYSRSGGQLVQNRRGWNHTYPTDTQILANIFSWHFDKENCDKQNFSLFTDQATIQGQNHKYIDRLKGVYIQCKDIAYQEPYYEISNQGNLFPTEPGNRSLFQAIVIYLYILYRQGELIKKNLQDVSKFVLQPLLRRF